MHPLGRLGKPGDIVAAMMWLLSDDASWVTGQVIGVDGGLGSLKVRN
jgi:NAD(P)-dependent dehydrogenase (short-subunit alcohol dehydrogenase family)